MTPTTQPIALGKSVVIDRDSYDAIVVENERLTEALRSLASYLGVGGYSAPDPIDPAKFEEKIRWGIDEALRHAEARGMERAAKICHAHNLTLEYTGQPLQDCISNRIRAEAAKLSGEST